MKTFWSRSSPCIARAILVLCVAPTVHAVEPLFPNRHVEWTPSEQGSYIRWANPPEGPTSGRHFFPIAGQAWSHDDEFDVYRAFLLYWVPRFHGVVTRDDIGLPDSDLPEMLRANVTGGALSWAGAALEPDWWAETAKQPLEVRVAAVDADALLFGDIDPETAFNNIGEGLLIGRTEGNLAAGPQALRFNQAFANLLNEREAGWLALSLTLPFVAEAGYTELAHLQPEYYLKIEFDGYAAFPPVPEPSTYALFATALLAGVVFVRRKKNSARS